MIPCLALGRGCTTRLASAAVAVLLLAIPAVAADFNAYRHVGSFNFPYAGDPADQGPTVFNALSDGRLLGVSTLIIDHDFNTFLGVPKVYLETAVGSRDFQFLGDLPLPGGAVWDASGGAFLQISPGTGGGTRIAVGNNRPEAPLVGVFSENDLLSGSLGSLPISWYEVDHFTAAWADDRHLAINSGDFLSSRVHLLDTDSSTGAPVRPLVVDGVAGASGGVGFDADGNMYVSNGFASGTGSATGAIKSFDKSAWEAALSSSALNFETDGSLVATLLSGGSLVFDHEGSMLVGGADFFDLGQQDFFALFPGPGLGSTPRFFDPDETATSFYVLAYNQVTQEFYAYQPFALDFPPNIDNTLVFVFSAQGAEAVVPEPAAHLLLAGGLALALRGRRSRRRRAA